MTDQEAVTVVRKAARAIVYDRARDRHVYRSDVDIAFRNDEIVYVGTEYPGTAERSIDGSRKMVMPGMISIHGHSSSAVKAKGCWEELGSPRIYMSTLFEYQSLMHTDDADNIAMSEFAVGEMLRSGCTTMMDIFGAYDGWLETLADTGIRAYVAPMYASAAYKTSTGHSMEYVWDETAGQKGLDEAIRLVGQAEEHPSGRLRGVISPAQVDTCTVALLRDSVSAAEELGVPRTIHAAQSVHEFREMVNRHGLSSMEFLEDVGFLGPSAILGHGIFLDDHPWIHQYPGKRDRRLLAERECNVAHCPAVIARRGILLNHFQSYIDAGINVGIGMDIYPHNIVDEMRWGLVCAKIAAGSQHGTSLAAMFHAATRGGAQALGRDDLGIIEDGARADLVLVDLDHPDMNPGYDPLAALVFSGLERPICDVFVAGRHLVQGGVVQTVDMAARAAQLNGIQQRGFAAVADRDWARRSAEQAFPLSLPLVD